MEKERTLTGLLKKVAADFPNRRAVSARGGEFEFDLTHARLQELVDHAAALLAAYGVGVGNVVALAFPSTVEFVILFLAVIRCRAAAAPLKPASTAEDFELYLSGSKAKLLLTPQEGNQPAQSAASKLNIPHPTAKLDPTDSKIALSSTDIEPDLDLISKVINDPLDVALFLPSLGSGSRLTEDSGVTQKDLAAAVRSHMSNIQGFYPAKFEDQLIDYNWLVRELLRYLAAGVALTLGAAARSSALGYTVDMISGDARPTDACPCPSNDMPEGSNAPKTTEENKTTETERGGEEAKLTEALANLGGPKKFSYEELGIATNYFASDQKLGEGGFGIVYKGHIGEDREPVAVKKIRNGSRQGREEYISEVKSLSQLGHINLVRLKGYCHESNEFILVYEFIGGGSLDDHLFIRRPPLTWERRYGIARGLASALLYLHTQFHQCVIHRDIKSSNVMLDENFAAKLGDFGVAKLFDHTRDAITTEAKGTWGYWAPELIRTCKASKECDVYSFGVVLLEIGSGRRALDRERDPPNLVEWVWKQYGPKKLLHAVDKKLGKDFDRKQAEALMIAGLWCAHPIDSRPSIEMAMAVLNLTAKPPKLPSKMPSLYV